MLQYVHTQFSDMHWSTMYIYIYMHTVIHVTIFFARVQKHQLTIQHWTRLDLRVVSRYWNPMMFCAMYLCQMSQNRSEWSSRIIPSLVLPQRMWPPMFVHIHWNLGYTTHGSSHLEPPNPLFASEKMFLNDCCIIWRRRRLGIDRSWDGNQRAARWSMATK